MRPRSGRVFGVLLYPGLQSVFQTPEHLFLPSGPVFPDVHLSLSQELHETYCGLHAFIGFRVSKNAAGFPVLRNDDRPVCFVDLPEHVRGIGFQIGHGPDVFADLHFPPPVGITYHKKDGRTRGAKPFYIVLGNLTGSIKDKHISSPSRGVILQFRPSASRMGCRGDGFFRHDSKPILTPALSLKERGISKIILAILTKSCIIRLDCLTMRREFD